MPGSPPVAILAKDSAMNAMSLASAAPVPETRRAIRGRRGWQVAASAGLLLAGVLLLIGARQPGFLDQQKAAPQAFEITAVEPLSAGVAVMPSAPVAGVLTLAIPPGAAADQRLGGRGYVMPSVISLDVGDTIVIRNDDDAPHMILYTFLMPGETDTRTFTEVGSEVYSSGCGLHAASFLNFTTIFVSEPESGKQ